LSTEEELRLLLLDHAKHPRNDGVLGDADGMGECRNPLCGDHVRVTMKVDGDQVLEVKIKSTGCSISIASASLMSQIVKKLKVSEIKNYSSLVAKTLSARPQDEWSEEVAELLPFKRMRENPMKVPCVLISWAAVTQAVENLRS
jgi:nitrogen fixation protein NifU and related proteins